MEDDDKMLKTIIKHEIKNWKEFNSYILLSYW